MLTIATAIAWLLAVIIVGGTARFHYIRACKIYNVKKAGKNYVVRDSKGRFVTITDNVFNVCKLGV